MPAIWQHVQSLVARAEASAPLRRFDPVSRRGLVWGGLEGGLVGLALGIVLGAMSSGALGALVGAFVGLLLGTLLGGVCGALIGALALQTGPPPEITFELDHPEATYAPGERITGLLRIAAPARANLVSGQVSLLSRGMFAHEETRQTEPPTSEARPCRGEKRRGIHHPESREDPPADPEGGFDAPLRAWRCRQRPPCSCPVRLRRATLDG